MSVYVGPGVDRILIQGGHHHAQCQIYQGRILLPEQELLVSLNVDSSNK